MDRVLPKSRTPARENVLRADVRIVFLMSLISSARGALFLAVLHVQKKKKKFNRENFPHRQQVMANYQQ